MRGAAYILEKMKAASLKRKGSLWGEWINWLARSILLAFTHV